MDIREIDFKDMNYMEMTHSQVQGWTWVLLAVLEL
jgi:hypothetical protein